MSLGIYCPGCGNYHDGDRCKAPIGRLARLQPQPKSREHIYGYAVIIALGVVAVLSLGWCA